MKNVMIDLETLGQTPGCVVMSIGAVAFDPMGKEQMDEGFYTIVSKQDCLDHYLSVDPETVAWWNKQSPEARKVLRDAELSDERLLDALAGLNNYVKQFGGRKNCIVWGNGASFDQPILNVAYKMVDLKPAWAFWNENCYRTMKRLIAGPPIERVGTYHNALDDAKSQALHLVELAKRTEGMLQW